MRGLDLLLLSMPVEPTAAVPNLPTSQPKRAASKIYPLIAQSETECRNLFHDALKTFGSQNARSSCIVAIKIPDAGTLYLIRAMQQRKDGMRSVLKSNVKHGSISDFQDCDVRNTK